MIAVHSRTCVFVCVRPQADALRSELDVLSERYTQKCLELSCTEKSGKSRETELDRKQRELEQLQRENQVSEHILIDSVSILNCKVTA